MAQLNRQAAYLFTVSGITPWERLRVIRNFLTERKQALLLAELEKDNNDAKLKQLAEDSYEYKKIVIETSNHSELIADTKYEIEFLENLEKELKEVAEETRVPGKTDREMYEINYFTELTEQHALEVHSQIVTTGTISPELMKTLIRNPNSLKALLDKGIIPKNIAKNLKFNNDNSLKLTI